MGLVLWGWCYRWQAAVSTSIVLAKPGADPKVEHKGRTLLQELKHRRKEVCQFPPVNQHHIREPKGLSVVIEIVEHHEKHGSRPDFTSTMGRWHLEGPAQWEVDESGQIIFDDSNRHLPMEADRLNINVAHSVGSVSNTSQRPAQPGRL
jgi:hypothetical protein